MITWHRRLIPKSSPTRYPTKSIMAGHHLNAKTRWKRQPGDVGFHRQGGRGGDASDAGQQSSQDRNIRFLYFEHGLSSTAT